jgi:Ca-activated chloride channel family protein
VVPVALFCLVAMPRAQEAQPPGRIQEPTPRVFRSSASMVALNVTVTDGHKLITGLNRRDFAVYEDGVQQEVRFFESSNVPMDVILLLDTSSSMRDRMPVVHEAAKSFMKILRPGDRGAIVAFSDNVRVIQDLTSDASAIESAISSTVAAGATALHNAIYVSLKQFGHTAHSDGEVRRQAIAVLSDGDDTSSLISFDDVVRAARRVGVSVYTISLRSEFAALRQKGRPAYFSQSDFAMKTLAKETGARSFFPGTVQELQNVYAVIAGELEAQYSIAYSPTNSRPDGRFRRIVVRITSDPSFTPRARAGYTAESTRASNEGLR